MTGAAVALDYGAVLAGKYSRFLLDGALTTLELTASAWLLAVPVAMVVTGLRASPSRVARAAMASYVEYHRSVPLLVQLFVWYFAVSELLPPSLNRLVNAWNSEFLFAVVALLLYSAAYMSEDLRSGLRSIPPGQYEASRALGLGRVATMRLVILPQAWRAALPPLVNQALILFKGTSLASVIGVAELTYQARQIESQTFRPFEAFSVITLIYFMGTFTIMATGSWLARRVRVAGH